MWGSRLQRVALVLVVLAGSQLGHALSYFVRFGMAAGAAQSTGVHAYFPAVTGVLSAVVGGLLMAGLLLVAAARSVRSVRSGLRPQRATVRFSDLLPLLFTAQLVLFVGQETMESWAAGVHVPSVIEQLIWGTIGQLPAAVIAAAVLAWLLARLEAAWTVLVDAVVSLLDEHATPAFERAGRPEPAPTLRLASAFPAAFRKRGPPHLHAEIPVS